jgi:glycosyltransferase involved in cell wall biosynthesis
MQEKSKVLLFSSTYLPLIGGSELAIKNITDRLSDFDFDLITTRFNKKFPKEERIGNVRVHRVGLGYKFDKFLFPVLGFFKALKLILPKTLLHAYQASYAGGAVWLIKFFKKNHFILTLQEGKELDSQNFFIKFSRNLIIRKADRATAISRYLKNYIFKISEELRTELIPNGVDVEKFFLPYSYGEMTDLENRLGIMPDDKVIISSSRFVHKNGLDLLIRALPGLFGRNKYKLLLAGSGPLEKSLKSLVASLHLENSVIFAGEVGYEELPLYLKISDVFVRPSRSEGLGSAFLEAMAAGVPVIGPRVGGIPDFLEDRKTGLICKLEPEDIASKINIVLENEGLRQEMVRNGIELVKANYDWEKIAGKFREFYKSF